MEPTSPMSVLQGKLENLSTSFPPTRSSSALELGEVSKLESFKSTDLASLPFDGGFRPEKIARNRSLMSPLVIPASGGNVPGLSISPSMGRANTNSGQLSPRTSSGHHGHSPRIKSTLRHSSSSTQLSIEERGESPVNIVSPRMERRPLRSRHMMLSETAHLETRLIHHHSYNGEQFSRLLKCSTDCSSSPLDFETMSESSAASSEIMSPTAVEVADPDSIFGMQDEQDVLRLAPDELRKRLCSPGTRSDNSLLFPNASSAYTAQQFFTLEGKDSSFHNLSNSHCEENETVTQTPRGSLLLGKDSPSAFAPVNSSTASHTSPASTSFEATSTSTARTTTTTTTSFFGASGLCTTTSNIDASVFVASQNADSPQQLPPGERVPDVPFVESNRPKPNFERPQPVMVPAHTPKRSPMATTQCGEDSESPAENSDPNNPQPGRNANGGLKRRLEYSRSMNDISMHSSASSPECLLEVSSHTHSLPSISADTLVELMDNRGPRKVKRFLIIDSRFRYEYDGGHIRGAKHFSAEHPENIIAYLFENPIMDSNLVIIFHCEFSSKRGPTMAQMVRNYDRSVNEKRYPFLYYPQVYILEKGYKNFFESQKAHCEPCCYTTMEDDLYKEACKEGMRTFQKWHSSRRSHSFCKEEKSRKLSFDDMDIGDLPSASPRRLNLDDDTQSEPARRPHGRLVFED